MSSEPDPEPEQRPLVIYVGQDKHGRWLVQGSDRQIEGRFVSRDAAISFARAEGEIYRAGLEMAVTPLVPLIPVGFGQARPQSLLRRVA